jgi:lysozyme
MTQADTTRCISQRGVNLIKRFEGFSAKAYKLPGEQFYTIGYGDYGAHVGKNDVITRAEGERRLRKRLREFEAGVNRMVTTHVNQNRFDALVSLAYNIGLGNFQKSTVLRQTNQRNFVRAAAAFHLWVRGATGKLPGLVRRRNAEARLFLRPVPRRR